MRPVLARIVASAALCLLLGGCATGGTSPTPSPPIPASISSSPAATTGRTATAAPTSTAIPSLAAPTIPAATGAPSSTASPVTAPPAARGTGTPAFTGYAAPYPAPATCATATWTPHQTRRTFPAFWLDGAGLAAGNPVGALLYEGGQKIQWQADPAHAGDLAIDGERLDAPAAGPIAARIVPLGGRIWSTETTFPAPGCWHLRATAGPDTLDAVVYVYPAACRPPAIGAPATPTPCAAP